MSSLDDLFDGPDEDEEPTPKKPPRYARRALNLEEASEEMKALVEGQSTGWFAKAFKIKMVRVKNLLKDCPPVGQDKHGNYRYDIATAAPYLVPPVQDLKAHLANIKAEDLPLQLRETFWNAKRKEIRYKTEAGQLWHTEDVRDAFGEIFMAIKDASRLWSDTIENTHGMTAEQRKLQQELVDKFLLDIQEKIAKHKPEVARKSVLGDLEDL